MNIIEIIEKKRDGGILSKEEINYFIEGYTAGSVADYQASALCMAIYLKGMNDVESTELANAMLESGDKIDLSELSGVKVDKHSTGGVGDKTSLVLAPLVASLGINFAKMSGRGLGHTGGTLDKLESIEGFNIAIAPSDFIKQVKRIKIAIVGQTGNLTPADKKLYALRDVTGTVSSIPLIASSIMSKKLASGADAICLDVKVGAGAFMKTLEDARKLATLMVQIGKNCGRNMTAVLTNMEEPLGFAVGNSLEVKEAIATLDGHGPKDLLDLCLEIGSYLVVDAGLAATNDEAKVILMKQIENKAGLNKLAELVEAQGGNKDWILNTDLFPKAKEVKEVISPATGYVHNIDALAVGKSAMYLGAGREQITDIIDPAVGVVLAKKVGDKVKKGDVLARVYTNGRSTEECMSGVLNAYKIDEKEVFPNLILDVVR